MSLTCTTPRLPQWSMAFRQRLCIGRGRWILGVVFLARQVDFFVRKDISDMCCKSRNCNGLLLLVSFHNMILLRSICWLHLNMFSCIHCAVTVLLMDTSRGDLRPKVDLEAGGWPHPIAVGCHRPFRTKCHVTTWHVDNRCQVWMLVTWQKNHLSSTEQGRHVFFPLTPSCRTPWIDVTAVLVKFACCYHVIYIGDHVASRWFYHCSRYNYRHLQSIVARQDRGYFRKYYGDKDIYDIESWPGFEKLSYLTPDFTTDEPFHQLKANKKAFQLQLLPHRKHRSFEQATVTLWTALCCSPLSWGKDM